jgi:hypothetical protein
MSTCSIDGVVQADDKHLHPSWVGEQRVIIEETLAPYLQTGHGWPKVILKVDPTKLTQQEDEPKS